MSFRLLLVLIVFVANAWAIARVLDSRMPRRGKVRWIATILALPVAGIVWYYRTAERAAADRPS